MQKERRERDERTVWKIMEVYIAILWMLNTIKLADESLLHVAIGYNCYGN